MENIKTASIEPWLTMKACEEAVKFYKTAFSASESYRLQDPDGGLVIRLSVNGAGFWISGGTANDNGNSALGGKDIRMILIVDDPDKLFAQALKAGATEIFPVGEGHGWRLGRLADPFGLHWEIGHQLSLSMFLAVYYSLNVKIVRIEKIKAAFDKSGNHTATRFIVFFSHRSFDFLTKLLVFIIYPRMSSPFLFSPTSYQVRTCCNYSSKLSIS